MSIKNFNGLLAILLVTSMITAFSVVTTVVASVVPNPEGVWIDALWGTKLRLENTYIGEAWFGAGPTPENSEYFEVMPDFMQPVFLVNSTKYDKLVKENVAVPQSYSWDVKLYRGGVAPSAGTLSWVLESDIDPENKYVPTDFSIVLENAGAGIFVNLRAQDNEDFSLPTYATLYVDNAVNVSISPPSITDNAGTSVSFTVTVSNTGRYDDTYSLSSTMGTISPSLPVSASSSDTATLNVTLPVGTNVITVTADGAYADDEATCTVTGVAPGIVILQGKETAWNDEGTWPGTHLSGIPYWHDYAVGSRPPIMVGENSDHNAALGSGAYVVAPFVNSLDYWPYEPDNMDILFDEAFKWMVSDAENVLWYEGYSVFFTASLCSEMRDALEALGYNVDTDDRPFENLYAGFTIPGYTIPPGTLVENLLSIDDQYAIENDPTSAGYDSTDVHIGRFSYEDNDRAFIKWDLTGLSATATSITSATLILQTYWDPDNDMTAGFYVSDDAWNEDNMCWDNMPTTGAQITTLDMVQEGDAYWRTLDVTSYVTTQFNTDNVVSIMIKSENEDLPIEEAHSCQFAAKESFGGANGPFLEITYLGEETVIDPVVYENGLENYDILMIPPLGIGPGSTDGDPTLLPDADVAAIDTFVQNGGGLFVMPTIDMDAHSNVRELNKILSGVGANWWVQSDTIYDNINYDDTAYAYYQVITPRVDVKTDNPVGLGFYSRTGNENKAVYKAASMILKPTIDGEATVPYGEGRPGDNVNLSIKVKNTGSVWDNFTVDVSDDMGWVAPLTTVGPLDPGEETTIFATVVIPDNAIVCTMDNITVTLTSFDDPSVITTWENVVHVITALAFVVVDIVEDNGTAHCSVIQSPVVNPSYRYDSLTFTVAVTNDGELDDKYELTIETDNTDLGLKLTPDEFFVPAGDTEYAALSVTIPEDWWAGWTGEVTVVAEGKMASSEQVVIGPTSSDSVEAIAGENAAVAIELLPDNLEPQTGAPGSPITWLVVIKNIGNVPDDFDINTTSDQGWGATSSLDSGTYLLNPGEKIIGYLREDIPESAKTSDKDNIRVTVVGTHSSAGYTVYLHVLEPGPRIPEGVIEIAVEAEVIAIDVWPTQFDFGVMDEHKTMSSIDNYVPSVTFTVRNTGNVDENILVRGTDAQSMPGEPVTTWTLDDVSVGVDQYMLVVNSLGLPVGDYPLSTSSQSIWEDVAPGNERLFGLTIHTPTVITTSARMWARVKLVAVKAQA